MAESQQPSQPDPAAGERPAAPARRGRSGLGGLLATFGFFPVAFAIVLGMLGGIGAFTFGYGQGYSYMLNDPKVCANCHIMQDHFDTYVKSSHHDVATCNDCHLPHDFVGKWVTKADNGFFHSLAFTTGDFPEPLKIKPRNREVTQNACLHCHADFVDSLLPAHEGGDMLYCVSCHSDVGHAGRRRGLSER